MTNKEKSNSSSQSKSLVRDSIKLKKDKTEKKKTQINVDDYLQIEELLSDFNILASETKQEEIKKEIINFLHKFNFTRFPKEKTEFSKYVKKILDKHLPDISNELKRKYKIFMEMKEDEKRYKNAEAELIKDEKIDFSKVKSFIDEYQTISSGILEIISHGISNVYDKELMKEENIDLMNDIIDIIHPGIGVNNEIPRSYIAMIFDDRFTEDTYGNIIPKGGLEELKLYWIGKKGKNVTITPEITFSIYVRKEKE